MLLKKQPIKLFFLIFLLTNLKTIAQNDADRILIQSSYNVSALKVLESQNQINATSRKQKAIAFATERNLPIRFVDSKGFLNEIQFIGLNNTPIYYKSFNSGGATTIKANKLYSGGGLNLSVEGQNMIAGVWDGSAVRTTHQDLSNKITIKDNVLFNQATASDHATHVTGSIVSSGANNANAKGIAFQAKAWTNEWNNDLFEATNQASQGLLISNHSYGYNSASIPEYYFGAYLDDSRDWDQLMYTAPYYLMVVAAGNDRNDGVNSTKNGFDLLTGHTTSKNNIVVGAVNEVSNYTSAASVIMSTFSSWGPTDDGRIKPDFVTKGVSVLSTGSNSNTSYTSLSGTSMASPIASGGLLLLQQYFKEKNGYFMKAATLKGLAIHNTDEAGNATGPDYRFGWGLLNLEKAANHITGNGNKTIISENTLENGKTFTQTVTANGTEPIIATLSWTDPAGNINTGTIDLSTPVLTNDLDIRINNTNTTYTPWKLNPASPTSAATKGDNTVDPIEKINIDNPTGSYTITVTHKGNLKNNKQNFSLLVSGVGSSFNLTGTPTNSVCNSNSTQYNFTYSTLSSSSTALTATNLPKNATVTFSQNSISSNGNFTATIGNLNNVTAGTYSINIIGTNGTEVKSFPIELKIFNANFSAVSHIYPANNEQNIKLSPILTWSENNNAQNYKVEIATNASFSNIVEQATTTTNSYQTSLLVNNKEYFWRIKPINGCANGSYSNNTSFVTQNLTVIEGENTNIQTLPDFEIITSIINIAQSTTIDDINVSIDLNHTAMEQLYITLKSPSGKTIVLQDYICGDKDDMVVTYDDQGKNLICTDGTPTINGTYKPKEELSSFNNENGIGDWTLTIDDSTLGDKGQLNKWSIKLSKEIPANLSTISFDSLEFKLAPNPAQSTLNITSTDLITDFTITLFDNTGRLVLTKDFKSTTGQSVLNVEHLAKGMYIVKINFENKTSTSKLIIQ